MPKLSVIIITLNEEANILRAVESAKPVADEIVVVDSLSSDRTAEMARESGCRVFLRKFDGYGPQKQFAVTQASNDWIMYLDADEVLTEELQQEIRLIFTNGNAPANSHHGSEKSRFSLDVIAGFNVQSSLCYMGKILRHSGVGKEIHLRLFNRNKGGFTDLPVHEGIEVTGETRMLRGRVIHYSYRGISHHLDKINHYTTLAAEGYFNKGRRFSKLWVAFKFPVSFVTFYIIKCGFLDGYPGFVWSLLAAVYASVKVAKTIEKFSKT